MLILQPEKAGKHSLFLFGIKRLCQFNKVDILVSRDDEDYLKHHFDQF